MIRLPVTNGSNQAEKESRSSHAGSTPVQTNATSSIASATATAESSNGDDYGSSLPGFGCACQSVLIPMTMTMKMHSWQQERDTASTTNTTTNSIGEKGTEQGNDADGEKDTRIHRTQCASWHQQDSRARILQEQVSQ
jgi:hypothetical protein